MTVELVPLSEKQFLDFRMDAVREYAEEHIKAGNWREEEALDKAEQEFRQLLPNGVKTENHQLFSVTYQNEQIGILWIYIRQNTAEKQAFIYDIKLAEQHRGKGLGKMTMAALDQYALKTGIKKIALHVFAHNKTAIALYEKSGYITTDYHMAKTY